jgi:membrane-associated phospholipid phosphatase
MFYPSTAAGRCWTRARTCPANGARRPGTGNGRAAAACLDKMESMMARWHIGATEFDRRVARAVARNARPAIERPARLLTWIADEHLLVAITAGLWLAARHADDDARRQADHLVLSVAAAAVLPHLLKRLIDQERPDRSVVHGRRHGIPRSGKPYDAFPSGHAVHVGAVASAVSWARPRWAPVAWGLGLLVAATRIVLLAHWTSDVLAGLTIGALIERCLRPLSRPRARPEAPIPLCEPRRFADRAFRSAKSPPPLAGVAVARGRGAR